MKLWQNIFETEFKYKFIWVHNFEIHAQKKSSEKSHKTIYCEKLCMAYKMLALK